MMPPVVVPASNVGNLRAWVRTHAAKLLAFSAAIDDGELDSMSFGSFAVSQTVLLVANDGRTAFEVPRLTASSHSAMLGDLLSELERIETDPQGIAELKLAAAGDFDDALLLEQPGVVHLAELENATPAVVGMFATWLERRREVPASVLEVPTPSLVSLEDLVDDPWDAEYLVTRVSSINNATHDIERFSDVRNAIAFAAVIGASAWQDLLCAFTVFQLRRALRIAPRPADVARRWLRKGDAWSDAELQAAETWGASTVTMLADRSVERALDTARWEKELGTWGMVNDLPRHHDTDVDLAAQRAE